MALYSVLLLLSAVLVSSVAPSAQPFYWTFGYCVDKPLPSTFTLEKLTSQTWFEISKLQNNFEGNASCVKLDLFLQGVDLTLAFSAKFENQTEGVITGNAKVELTGNETNIQVSFPGDEDPMKLTVLDTDFDNFAILYSCTQHSTEPLPTKEERAWILSKQTFFEDAVETMVNDILINYDFRSFLDETNQQCAPETQLQ